MDAKGRPEEKAPVVHTTLRLDAVLFSTEGKKIILVELTVPWEEGCEEAFKRKYERYRDLVQDCRDKGWQTPYLNRVIEVGWKASQPNQPGNSETDRK